MFSAVELRKNHCAGSGGREVADVPNLVIRPGPRIPARDQSLIHLRHGCERPTCNVEDAVIAEMGIAGEEHAPRFLPACLFWPPIVAFRGRLRNLGAAKCGLAACTSAP